MKSLEPPDTFHLSAALGWLGLGNWREAQEELEKITPSFHAHPDALETRWEIYARAGKWDECVNIGYALVRAAPERSFGWIHRSFALHELKRTPEAVDLLVPAAFHFPNEWLIRYNLACYACLLENHQEAREWLKFAFDLGGAKKIKLLALNDTDLRTMWAEIEEI